MKRIQQISLYIFNFLIIIMPLFFDLVKVEILNKVLIVLIFVMLIVNNKKLIKYLSENNHKTLILTSLFVMIISYVFKNLFVDLTFILYFVLLLLFYIFIEHFYQKDFSIRDRITTFLSYSLIYSVMIVILNFLSYKYDFFLSLDYLLHLNIFSLALSLYGLIKCYNKWYYTPILLINIVLINSSYYLFALILTLFIGVFFTFKKSYVYRSFNIMLNTLILFLLVYLGLYIFNLPIYTNYFDLSVNIILIFLYCLNVLYYTFYGKSPYLAFLIITIGLILSFECNYSFIFISLTTLCLSDFLTLFESLINKKKVAVLMVSDNTSIAYLKDSIDSILENTHKNLELIIICDGGFDDYEFIKNNYNDHRIKVIRNEKKVGVASSLNQAISLSSADYLVCMDSHDVAYSDRLFLQIAFMENNPKVMISGTDAYQFGQKNSLCINQYCNYKYIKTQLLYKNPLIHSTIIIRKSYLNKTKLLYDEEYFDKADYELWTRCENAHIEALPLITIKHRYPQDSKTKDRETKYYEKIMTDNLERLNINDAFKGLQNLLILSLEKKMNKDNYIELSNYIDELVKIEDYKSYASRSVLYNRYFKLLVDSGLIYKEFLNIVKNVSILKKIFLFNNLVYLEKCLINKIFNLFKKFNGILKNIKIVVYKTLLKLDESKVLRLSDKKYAQVCYFVTFKRTLNLRNPKEYNEKLNWLKLYNHNPIYQELVDNYSVRKYISRVLGDEYLIHLMGACSSIDDIDFDKLPHQFVMKSSFNSKNVLVCQNKNYFDKENAKRKMNEFLNQDKYLLGREWPYKNISPKILVEKYIEDDTSSYLIDYKFYAFNGLCDYVRVYYNQLSENNLDVFFDRNWHVQKDYSNSSLDDASISKPQNLDKMFEFAKILSQNIPFVLISFYEINGHLYFGSMSFYPESGFDDKINDSFRAYLSNKIKI